MSWFVGVLLALFTAGSESSSPPLTPVTSEAGEVRYARPEVLCRVASDVVVEASGLVAGRHQPGIFWITNDSGDRSRLFAVDTRGRLVATLEVRGAANRDWEDLAIGPGQVLREAQASGRAREPRIYIADTGNNDRSRAELTIYRVREPRLSTTRRLGQKLRSEPAEVFHFRYAEGRFDCEGMVVHPRRPEVWLFTKESIGVGVYRLDVKRPSPRPVVLARIATLAVGSLATGAGLSPDGSRFALRFYFGLCEWRAASGGDVLERLSQKPSWIVAPTEPQSEAVCYSAAGDALFTVSEGRHPAIYRLRGAER